MLGHACELLNDPPRTHAEALRASAESVPPPFPPLCTQAS